MMGIEANPFEASQAPEGRAAASSGRGATVFRDVLAAAARRARAERSAGGRGRVSRRVEGHPRQCVAVGVVFAPDERAS
jgi:hypothetical protein